MRLRCSLLIYVDDCFVEERFVERLPAKSTTEQLDIEPTLLKCQYQLVGDDRLSVLFKAPLTLHLLLKHASEQLCRLICLWQAFAADELLQQAKVPALTVLRALVDSLLVEKFLPEPD